MKLDEKIQAIIDLSAKQSAAGSGEITQGVYDRAHSLLGEGPLVRELSKFLEIDCEAFFTNLAVGVGVLTGMRERLQTVMLNETSAELPQTDAYVLVDLWGRALGLKSLLIDIAECCEAAKTDGVGERPFKARMATCFVLLESIMMQLCAELSKRSLLSVVGDSLDRLMTLVYAERRGPLGAVLKTYVQELPA